MSLGKRIAELRNSKSLTQEQLAEKLYVTRQAVSRWENDETEPDINMLRLIANTLKISITDLIDTPLSIKASIAENEKEFGAEARERYGNKIIDAANKRLMEFSQDEWDAKKLLEESIKVQLRVAIAEGSATGEEAKELVHMHRRWVAMYWGKSFNQKNYLALVRAYPKDPRFVEYYDKVAGTGATDFLISAIEANCV